MAITVGCVPANGGRYVGIVYQDGYPVKSTCSEQFLDDAEYAAWEWAAVNDVCTPEEYRAAMIEIGGD